MRDRDEQEEQKIQVVDKTGIEVERILKRVVSSVGAVLY